MCIRDSVGIFLIGIIGIFIWTVSHHIVDVSVYVKTIENCDIFQNGFKKMCIRDRGYAAEENLEAVEVAVVTEEPRLVLEWRGKEIVKDVYKRQVHGSLLLAVHRSSEADFVNQKKYGVQSRYIRKWTVLQVFGEDRP